MGRCRERTRQDSCTEMADITMVIAVELCENLQKISDIVVRSDVNKNIGDQVGLRMCSGHRRHKGDPNFKLMDASLSDTHI